MLSVVSRAFDSIARQCEGALASIVGRYRCRRVLNERNYK